MTNNALDTLYSTAGNGGSSDNSFSPFGVGKTYKVRVLGVGDLDDYVGYSIFKKVNTFKAKEPSTRDKNGYATGNFTPWDKAENHYRQLQFAAIDRKDEAEKKKQGTLAGLYKGNPRFILGFIDLETGETLAIDMSKPQALAVHSNIKKYEKKLGKLAFELTKTNPTGEARDTKVALTPLIDFEDDLTPEEQAVFKSFDGKEFDKARFGGVVYEADEAEQLTFLQQAGFDIALIGASKTASEETAGGPIEMSDDDLPF